MPVTRPASSQAHAIRAISLARRFGDKLALAYLDFAVKRGEVFGLLGHNGAGKTTTIRLLNGVLAPTSGSAEVLGLSPMQNGEEVRRRCGVLTETPSLEERLTARQNLRYYADLYGVEMSRIERRIDELLAAFGLREVGDAKVGSFSKGMKQRLALSRALLHEPEILYLDEPTAGLDPVAARRVLALIRELSREAGRTVVLCTHNLAEAQEVCDRVAVLERGRLLVLGAPTELARRYLKGAPVVIEVAPEVLEQALACAQGFEGLEVSVEAGRLVILGLERERIPALVAALVERAISVYRVEPRAPSLEDVYFALHRRPAKAELVEKRDDKNEREVPA